ncbi:hypothetical protein [Neorhizobium sp. NCHU2750]|uniref:hypothetical protein n=1 Tax=Neorhizobium sp. NCHU2750 TaxID=1825976 RepID=UPI000E72E3F5|nr:hypothetical protein NCHU2750_29510 [Neorhizobium sp. NCHU2750]
MKIRLSKKLIFVLGGALVLCGASGSAAVLIGTDKILGPSYKDINGLSCTTLQTYKMRRGQSVWVRRYVTSDQSGDGVERVKTALRVARAVQEREKAGLVQVAMIDASGPKDTADMRGRAIAAQVVYIPDPSKVASGAPDASYSAYYMDGKPSSTGEFYGMRVDLPLEDIQHMEASLTDKTDCVDPTAAAPAAGGEHGAAAAAEGHGGKKKSPTHGMAPADAEKSSGHEQQSETEGAKAEEAEGKGEEVAAKESGGFMSSITGMVFGSKEKPAAGHDEQVPAENAGAAKPAGEAATGHEAASAAATEDHGAQPYKAADAAKPAEEKSFFDQAKSMIFGDKAETPPAPAETQANADSGHEAKQAASPAPEPAREPKTTAEGGKGWSKSDAADEIHAGGPSAGRDAQKAPDNAPAAAQPQAQGGGASAADAAGAEWLAKFRAQQSAPAADAGKPTH